LHFTISAPPWSWRRRLDPAGFAGSQLLSASSSFASEGSATAGAWLLVMDVLFVAGAKYELRVLDAPLFTTEGPAGFAALRAPAPPPAARFGILSLYLCIKLCVCLLSER
jgi:hypothetical protein